VNAPGHLASLLDWFLPPVCMACRVPVDPLRSDFLCLACRADIRVLAEPDCPCAGAGDPPDAMREGCEFCRRLPRGFASARAAFPYGGVVGALVRNMKYRRGEHAGEALARLTIAAMPDHFRQLKDDAGIDVVVPVPMHWWRRWRRGYNQAEAVGRALAGLLRLPCDAHAVARVRPTPPQARRADAAARLRNVAGVFRAEEPDRVAGRHVLLVDDVMTTGATMASCAAALRAGGAVCVHAVAVARAGPARLGTTPAEMRGEETT